MLFISLKLAAIDRKTHQSFQQNLASFLRPKRLTSEISHPPTCFHTILSDTNVHSSETFSNH